MRNFWNETSGANRGIMLAVAVAILGIVFGGLVLGSKMLDKDEAVKVVNSDDKNATVHPTAPPSTTTTTLRPLVTTTTAPNGMTRQQIENPESAILDSFQLAYAYNQKNSRLSARSYEVGSQIAAEFAEASASGKGASKFAEYFDLEPNNEWVTDYKLVYATVSGTEDQTLVKARVWFTGKEKASGLPMKQVQHVFMLTRPSNTSLNFKPYFSEFPIDEPDIGITIAS